MEEIITYYRLEFDFDYLELVDKYVKDSMICKKIFHKNCEYIIKLDETHREIFIDYLLNNTYNLVKVTKITSSDDELPEVGTDKPIGSKLAIDEN